MLGAAEMKKSGFFMPGALNDVLETSSMLQNVTNKVQEDEARGGGKRLN